VAVRQYFIRHFLDGRIKVLANYQVLTTGFDAPKTRTIVISRPVFMRFFGWAVTGNCRSLQR
jgi:superfamily II DNA or RNA helicase